jgi:TDG/mug DNA glycosylase family protein
MTRTAASSESDPAKAPDILPDVLAPGLAVVFCGSAPGTYSAQVGAYYAKPGNAFWPTLHRVGLTPRLFKPQEFAEVLRYRIGLTDLGKHAFGADHELPAGAYDTERLRRTILHVQPRLLAFAAKAPARAFLGRAVTTGRQPERIGETEIWVLSSPSGRARRFWDEAAWQALAARVAALRDPAAG